MLKFYVSFMSTFLIMALFLFYPQLSQAQTSIAKPKPQPQAAAIQLPEVAGFTEMEINGFYSLVNVEALSLEQKKRQHCPNKFFIKDLKGQLFIQPYSDFGQIAVFQELEVYNYNIKNWIYQDAEKVGLFEKKAEKKQLNDGLQYTFELKLTKNARLIGHAIRTFKLNNFGEAELNYQIIKAFPAEAKQYPQSVNCKLYHN